MSKDNLSPEPQAYDIAGFCKAHNISRSSLYILWAAGTGPTYFSIGSKRLISKEAAARWARRT